MFIGQENFEAFFETLENKFGEFEQELTHEVSEEKLVLLDIQIYIGGNQFNTKERTPKRDSE